ncbi:YcgN family cysteine cluster protein [Wohlfahrtiimonas sp. G9077]|uniref:YcgN family cysteine cluster protein n=1 Tax=Wohlfahrtiimonas sp. G9077 TaxID=1980118 RepID=UPI000B99451E|nr:YcgN family cysteine cluster protein [Wohlfahrtiimonas sp. G9077]OYQ74397.1 hypothetical protein B9T20_03780 [Wohlfahrtiimonas sp. G9077]
MDKQTPFWEAPLETLSSDEWEQLCDGCGLCCLNKIEDIDTGDIYTTRVACDLLDLKSCQCTNYANRKRFVPDCIKLTYEMIQEIEWLPESCAYIRRYHNQPLPKWHHLLTGSRDTVREYVDCGQRLIHEKSAKKPLYYYVIEGDLVRES